MEVLIRFLTGAVVVSLFAVIGDGMRPKSFAGIFGAAPSVALATLALTVHNDGAAYAALEARSMLVGALAFALYASVCARVLWSGEHSPALVTGSVLLLWLAVALLGGLLLSGVAA
jgi:hypothetical protein